MTGSRWLAIAAMAVHARLAGGAEAVSAGPDTAKELENVVVSAKAEHSYTAGDSSAATRLPLSPRDTPQSLTIITRQRLDDQKLVSLRDVLDNTPGIYSSDFDTERVVFTARGFNIDNLSYDGVPAATNSSTDSVDETIDMALYERIDVVRGATGLMTGAGSPSASINLVRKHAAGRAPRLAADLSAGSWNTRRGEVDLSAPLALEGAVRGRLVGVYQDRESYQNLYRNRRKVLYGIIDTDLSPHTLLSVGFDYQNTLPRGVTWGSFPLFFSDGTLTNWPRSVTTSADWTYWKRRKESVFGEIRHTFSNDWSVQATLTWRRLNERQALLYMASFPHPVTGEGLQPSAYRSNAGVIERSADLYASGPLELFGHRHELVVGYNGSRISSDAYEFSNSGLPDPGNFFLWNGSYPQPGFSSGGFQNRRIRIRQNGLYMAARIVVADPLKLVVGARSASWKTTDFESDVAPQPRAYDFNEVIPYAGVIYDLTGDFSAFASYTRIFKPQNSRDVNNAYLAPIDGKSMEVGIKGEHFGGRLNSEITVFQTYQNNIATAAFDPVTGQPIRLPDGTQASNAIPGTRTRGFELEVSGEILTGWNASVGWSHYAIEDGNHQPVRTFIPGTLVRTYTAWTVPGLSGRLVLGGGINFQSAAHTFVATPGGGVQFQQGGFPLVSALARYRITPQLSIQANANNLLDKKYYVLDQYDNTHYGLPANYYLGINLHL